MSLKPLASIAVPLAVAADLDPTYTPPAALPALLRLHCLLRRGLLVPEQFLLFSPAFLARSRSTISRAGLVDFLQNAPILVSQHNMSRYATCEDHLNAAAEEDHPFLIGVDMNRARSHARFLDQAIVATRRVGINTPAAEETFAQRFRTLAPHFGIAPAVTNAIDSLASRAAERPGRNETRSSLDEWNRNDVYLIMSSNRFDRPPFRQSRAAPELLRAEPTRSTILACARAAYLSVLGDQLEHTDQDVLLWVPDTYDLSRSTLQSSRFDEATARALIESPTRYELPIDALTSCPWKAIAEYLQEGEPETLKYFHARVRFLTARPHEKLDRLTDLAFWLHAHLKRAAIVLAPRHARKSSVEAGWHLALDSSERVFRFVMTLAVHGGIHYLTPSWIVAAVGHSVAENSVEVLRALSLRRKVMPLAATLRASLYANATVSDGIDQ